MDVQSFKKIKKSSSYDILNEILHEILNFLDIKNVIKLSSVNKVWNQVCLSDIYWKEVTKKNFKGLMETRDTSKSYYSFFKETWILKNIINKSFEEKITSKGVIGDLKPVFQLNKWNGPDNGKDFIFYNETITFCFQNSVYCISSKNYKIIWKKDYKNLRNLKFDTFTETLVTISNQNSLIFLTIQGKEIKKVDFRKEEILLEIYLHRDKIYVYSNKDENEAFLYAYSLDGFLFWGVPIEFISKEKVSFITHNDNLIVHNFSHKFESKFIMCWVKLKGNNNVNNVPDCWKRFQHEMIILTNVFTYKDYICLTFYNDNVYDMVVCDYENQNGYSRGYGEAQSLHHFNNEQTKEILEFVQGCGQLALNKYDENFENLISQNICEVSEDIVSVFLTKDDKFITIGKCSETNELYFNVFTFNAESVQFEKKLEIQFTKTTNNLFTKVYGNLVIIKTKEDLIILEHESS